MQHPHLQSFLGSWFHQDFDINGQSIVEITSLYKRSASALQAAEIIRDIDSFLEYHQNLRSIQLIEAFGLEVDPLGFAESARGFLEEIKDVLSRE